MSPRHNAGLVAAARTVTMNRVMPQCRRPARSPSDRPTIILSPWQTERNYGGNEFFTIVNRLLTIANTRLPARPDIHRRPNSGDGGARKSDVRLGGLNHPHLRPPKTPQTRRLFTWIWSRSGQSPRNK